MKNKNKGFTLVELIIVIAVIAILAAVLAPRYIQYVERARETNDLQTATNYMKAATVVLTDLSVGFHTSDNDWFVFKWGYSTSPGDGLNIHMGAAKVVNGMPTTYDSSKRDLLLQYEVASIMGWENGDGEYTDAGDAPLIDKPQSAAAAEVGTGGNSFMFYVNARTGEIYVDKGSAAWVNEIGVDAPLLP